MRTENGTKLIHSHNNVKIAIRTENGTKFILLMTILKLYQGKKRYKINWPSRQRL